jgi:hypothetical protein
LLWDHRLELGSPLQTAFHVTLARNSGVLMLHTLGWFIVAIVGGHMVVNALFMLVSPQIWFRLPNWIRTPGLWFEAKGAAGEGAIEARVTGASLLALIGWVLYASLLVRT